MSARKHSRQPWEEWDESKMGIFIGGPCGLHCYFQLELKIARQFRHHGWGALTEVQMDASDITNMLRGIFISSDTMSIYKIQILTWVELCILIWIVSGRTADGLRGEDSVYGSVMRDCADRQGEAHQQWAIGDKEWATVTEVGNQLMRIDNLAA